MTMILNKYTREQVVELRNGILDKRCSLDMSITRLLLSLGLRPHLFGTVYLRSAIKRCCALNSFARINFGNNVYPHVASECDTTPRRVERDIRTAIQGSYGNGGMFLLNAIVGYNLVSPSYSPTNSELIMGISSWLCLELAYAGEAFGNIV